MMMKIAVLSSVLASTTAFAPLSATTANTALRSTPDEQVGFESTPINSATEEMESATEIKAPPSINGWIADENLPCYGLPGALAPTGYFDPIGFSRNGITLNEVKRNREAEIMHGRVAMMAVSDRFIYIFSTSTY